MQPENQKTLYKSNTSFNIQRVATGKNGKEYSSHVPAMKFIG